MKQSGLYQYLEASGVLAHGSPADIEQARRTYWKHYKAQWRKRKRSETKSITVSFSKQEYAAIARNAQKITPTAFVHTAAVTFGKQHTMAVNEETIGYIQAVLLQNYHHIRDLGDEKNISHVTEQQLLNTLSAIEKMIMERLRNPVLLEEAMRTAISDDPEYKNTLQTILKNM